MTRTVHMRATLAWLRETGFLVDATPSLPDNDATRESARSLPTMRYSLRYVHKVSQRCKCGRSQYDHSREPREDEKARYPYPGQRVCGEGPYVRFYDGVQTCAGFEHETESIDLDVGQIETVAKTLAGAKCVIRHEPGGKIVCFPRSGIWHSLIFTPEGF